MKISQKYSNGFLYFPWIVHFSNFPTKKQKAPKTKQLSKYPIVPNQWHMQQTKKTATLSTKTSFQKEQKKEQP